MVTRSLPADAVCFYHDGESWICVNGDAWACGAHIGEAFDMLQQKVGRPLRFDYPLFAAAEALDNVTAALDSLLATFARQMTTADQIARQRLIDHSRELLERCFSETTALQEVL